MSAVLSTTTSRVSAAITASLAASIAICRHRRAVTLQATISENSRFSPSYLPVAIFVGGTAGIGQGTVEAFARHTHGNAHIILVGRNRAAAETIISNFPKATVAGAKHEFVQCDVSLMKNVERTTKSLLERLPRVNFLFLSTVFIRKIGRDLTEEGIDKKLAVLIYGRWKFIEEMLPALRSAAAKGEAATVYQVGWAGKGNPVDWDNLGFNKRYNVYTIQSQSPGYVDAMSQEFAAQNSNVSFAHAWPGVVYTNSQNAVESTLLRATLKFFKLLSYPLSMSITDSGEFMFRGMLNASKRTGWSRYDEDGTTMTKNEFLISPEEQKKFREHMLEETSKWKNQGV